MATIHSISINNFRGIKEFRQSFFNKRFICLIGRGDSGKSTILEAISYVLASSWNVTFYDSDFYNCDTSQPILIDATLTDLPDYFLTDKFGLHARIINSAGEIIDDPELDQGKPAITIQLKVDADLEPQWSIVNDRPNQEAREISAAARAKLNAFLITDYTDRHFSWNRGNPLNALLRNEESEENHANNIVINALRKAKQEIDNSTFDELQPVIDKVIKKAEDLGVDISGTSTTIDFKDISIKDNRVCLHDDANVPFRLKGKGIKRLISLSIQLALAQESGIILIDEVEQGLEPDRVQHLVSQLKKSKNSQVILTTHSSNVAVELEASDFYIVRKNATSILNVGSQMQDCLRKNSEALFAKKIIMCEGATEIGICKAINEYRIFTGKESASYSGIRFADGTGSNFINYCKGFNVLGYPQIVFCDSDDKAINQQKKELLELGIVSYDCNPDYSIEQQVFEDLPWSGIQSLINYQIEKTSLDSVVSSIESKLASNLESNWILTENSHLRQILGVVSKKNEWFKRIDHGKYVGSVICEHAVSLSGKQLGFVFKGLSDFMDNV